MSLYYTASDHFAILPGLLLAFFGAAILLIDFLVLPAMRQKKWMLVFVLLGSGFTAAALLRQFFFLQQSTQHSLAAFGGAIVVDGLTVTMNWVFLAAAVITCLISYRYLEIEGDHQGEYYGLILLAQCGMFFLSAATELVTVFTSLELMAISFYILVGFRRSDPRSAEAAMKYLILGAFSSGLLAYGFSLLYGLSGSTHFATIAAALAIRGSGDPMVLLAIATTGAGLLFKVAAAPFHVWAPDTYEGAPTPVTAYLSTASKAAAMALLLRLLLGPLATFRDAWLPALAAVAVLSLTIGNLAALTQSSVKRLLAYSSVSHAGYLLLGVIAGNETGIKGVTVYLVMYTLMNLGAFLVIVALRREMCGGESLEDFAGLAKRSPAYAVLMLICLLSLAGVPPTAGFIAKYFVLLALVESGHTVLAVIAAVYVAVAFYYYFRVVRTMFLDEPEGAAPLASSNGLRVALGITGLLTLTLGLFPEPVIRLANVSLLR